ncbi:MAG: hypothetical protein ACXABZ_00745 [Candidatus Thorarchaeota archaeon]|jgi:hypothetical protein
MGQSVSISSVFSRTTPSGDPYEPVSRISGIGGIFGIIAGVIGLLFSVDGFPLFQMPSMTDTLIRSPHQVIFSAAFIGLISAGLLFQMLGSRKLRTKLGSGYPNLGFLAALIGIGWAVTLPITLGIWTAPYRILEYVTIGASISAIFAILWILFSVVYVDSTDSWLGLISTLLNGFAFPLLAVGMIIPYFTYVGYIALIIGQLTTIFFWWSPLEQIRAYARSPDKAKFAFGLTGLITFLLGGIAVFYNLFLLEGGTLIWYPFGAPLGWNFPLVYSFLGGLLLWIMLGPRLGKKEIKAAQVGDDLVSGGIKYFMAFLAVLGIYAAAQAGTLAADPMATWSLVLAWCPSGIMFLMGSIYLAQTDVIVGLPLAVTGIMMLVHSFVLASFVIIPFILVIISQAFLAVETKIRGFTYFSQPILTIISTMAFSILFLIIMLGGLGNGPAALWPTNRWYNVAFFENIEMAVQAPTVLVLPMLALMVRNVTLSGYAHGKITSGKHVLGGLTVLFAFLVPLIATAFKGITHMALTAASILLGLYAISFVLVLSVNLTIATEVENTGNPIEGMLIRMTAIVGLVVGGLIAALVLATFSGFPDALQVSLVITLLVILIAGLEVLLFIGWLSSGVRLGMLRKGLSFTRREAAIAEVEALEAEIEILEAARTD